MIYLWVYVFVVKVIYINLVIVNYFKLIINMYVYVWVVFKYVWWLKLLCSGYSDFFFVGGIIDFYNK